ncbi:unnamed protein product [Trichogramma brassicae]|uniref:Uncharacterized protein n=1 Tax=Trichogramma brassicae TaxID=86971 RepID=A0A6H5IVD7_9HYME|nr:unnamed protein product [Trichogramma brassicae]
MTLFFRNLRLTTRRFHGRACAAMRCRIALPSIGRLASSKTKVYATRQIRSFRCFDASSVMIGGTRWTTFGGTWTTVGAPSLISASLRLGDRENASPRDSLSLLRVSGGVNSMLEKYRSPPRHYPRELLALAHQGRHMFIEGINGAGNPPVNADSCPLGLGVAAREVNIRVRVSSLRLRSFGDFLDLFVCLSVADGRFIAPFDGVIDVAGINTGRVPSRVVSHCILQCLSTL